MNFNKAAIPTKQDTFYQQDKVGTELRLAAALE
jgi:hypothetical protein